MKLAGVTVPEDASVASGSWDACNRYVIANLHNLFNHANMQVGGQYYPQVDFTDPQLYHYGLLAAKAAHDAAATPAE